MEAVMRNAQILGLTLSPLRADETNRTASKTHQNAARRVSVRSSLDRPGAEKA